MRTACHARQHRLAGRPVLAQHGAVEALVAQGGRPQRLAQRLARKALGHRVVDGHVAQLAHNVLLAARLAHDLGRRVALRRRLPVGNHVAPVAALVLDAAALAARADEVDAEHLEDRPPAGVAHLEHQVENVVGRAQRRQADEHRVLDGEHRDDDLENDFGVHRGQLLENQHIGPRSTQRPGLSV
jgi:hypothetical protein